MGIIEYWNALAAKAGDNRSWNQLPIEQQHVVITSVNLLLKVLIIKEQK